MKRITFLLFWLLIGAIVFQGFECSSRNITTAKVKIKNQQYDDAIESLNKELAVNPNSDEALALLADIYFQKQEIEKASQYAKKALANTKDTQRANQLKVLINNIWVECFNSGVNNYNKYISTKDMPTLDKAIQDFTIGSELRPEVLDFYNFLGVVYEAKGDTDNSRKYYAKYVEANDKNYQFAQKNGIYFEMDHTKMLEKMGNPISSTPGATGAGNSTVLDYYQVDGKDAFLFSEETKGKMLLVGWSYDTPKDWLESERKMKVGVNTEPYAVLAQDYANDKDYDNALKYAKMIVALSPNNSTVYNFMINIYQQLDRTDEAVETINNLIKSDPKNPAFITQLGDLQQNLQQYDEAIKSYNNALSVQPNFDRAVRNLAAAYKNRASVKQKKETEKRDADKKYEIDTEKYFPDLREAAKYFSEALNLKEYQNDMYILSDLANIYFVLQDEDNLKKTVRNLEAIENILPDEQKETYYLNMVKIHSQMGNESKLKRVQEKLK